ncbi:hypothetical protein B0H63DRAFT_565659 [Podospora didyma]|uniref:Rhodopsin domain-containing protein n=1 Tax=Podospora didyma TaxID=330526 RepID=A0AAE0K1M8_9PEZI|nr:hypothetical protein B0H63DRAFT_565659 [Podospora didyma]
MDRPNFPLQNFLATIWTTTAIAFVFVAVRLYARSPWGRGRGLYWDDALIAFAYLLFLAWAILWQVRVKSVYYMFPDMSSETHNEDGSIERWFRTLYIAHVLLYTCLTSVKVSLLMFFRRLGSQTQKLKYIWWPVLAYTLAAWVALIVNAEVKCLLSPLDYISNHCSNVDGQRRLELSIQINCALDVSSDFFIMLIPIGLIWKLRMRLARKLALAGLFSLSLITMAMAVVQALGHATRWTTFIWIFAAIEACIAIVISCLSAFPQLFLPAEKPASYTPSATFLNRFRSKQSSKNSRNNLHDLTGTHELFSVVSQAEKSDDISLSAAGNNSQPASLYNNNSHAQPADEHFPPLPSPPAPVAISGQGWYPPSSTRGSERGTSQML